MIVLDTLDPRQDVLWEALIELDRRRPPAWTLIGAQMVALHGLGQGRTPPRSSLDADVLVDIRLVQDGTERFAEMLITAGFEFEGMNLEGIGHRYRRGGARIDVLAPDGVGGRANVKTSPPARTVRVPGGSQALRRSRPVDVALRETRGKIPCPDLLGAILVKARAVEVDDVPESQLVDLAFLLGLVRDPRALAADLARGERGWLKRRKDLLDRNHSAWRGVANADDAHRALRLLAVAHEAGERGTS